MNIKFRNWKKYQKRTDCKRPSWFAMSNDLFIDAKVCELTNEEFIGLIYLLCEASKAAKNGEVFVSHEQHRKLGRIQGRELNRTIEKLHKLQIIEQPTLRGRYASVTHLYATEQNITEQDKTEHAVCSEVRNTHAPEPAPVIQEFSALQQEIKEYLSGVKQSVQRSWLIAYPDPEWVCQELGKAYAWIAANPKKAPKKFDRFFVSWLARGWEQYRKTIPSSQAKKEEERKRLMEILK